MITQQSNERRGRPAFRPGVSTLLAFAAVLLLGGIAVAQDAIMEADAERVDIQRPTAPTPATINLPNAFRANVNIRQIAAVTDEEINAADAEARRQFDVAQPPPRVGLVRQLGEAALSTTDGSALRVAAPDGSELITMAVRSPGAYALRLHFTGFDVGRGGSVVVYGEDATGVYARGPYTRKGPAKNGDFWTPIVPGDTAYIEVRGVANPSFTVGELVHFDRPPGGVDPQDAADVAGLLACHVDANCFAPAPISRDATGRMNFNVGLGSFLCSGTQLNDSDGETSVPYFITAFHCLSTQASVNTLTVTWGWETNACGGTLPNFNDLPTSNGGTLLETNQTTNGNDMTFIRLNGPLANGNFAGWTTGGLPANPQGYHHPGGSWRRGTTFFEGIVVGPCTGLTQANYHYLEASNGVTEGGSSGSGVFNGSDRLMGQLFGVCCPSSHSVGCGAGNSCCLSGCNNRDEYSVLYGRFNVTFPIIEQWLRVGGTINVDGDYVGVEQGTPTQPFNTVNEGNNFAWDGARIRIQGGTYNEAVTFSKELLILSENGSAIIGTN